MSQVLLVDDNEDARNLCEHLLKTNGVDVLPFASGMDALQYLESGNDAEIIILDLSMPTLDGLTVAEEIRRNEQIQPDKPPVRIVFLTARNIDDAIERIAERTGVEKIFQKNGEIEQLPAQIKEWLADKSVNQAS